VEERGFFEALIAWPLSSVLFLLFILVEFLQGKQLVGHQYRCVQGLFSLWACGKVGREFLVANSGLAMIVLHALVYVFHLC